MSALPAVLVVMGVSGSGKTTVAALLAGRLGWEYGDADSFHPRANIEKQAAGLPLTDADRLPWLECMASWIDATRTIGRHGVLACSALKRTYRNILIGERPDVRLVYLQGNRSLVGGRQAARQNHFMPASLIDSQFATLEEPAAEERPITVSVAPAPHVIVDGVIEALRA